MTPADLGSPWTLLGRESGETALSEKDLNAIGCFEGPTSSRPRKAYLFFVRQDSSSPFSSLQKKVYPPTDCKHKSLSCFRASKKDLRLRRGKYVPIGTFVWFPFLSS